MPSTAAQILVTVIPIVGIVTGGVLIFFFLLWNYRERRLLIEKNLYVRKELDVDTFSLLAGIVLLCIGLTLVIFFLAKEGLTYELLSGLVPFSLGVSLTLFFIIRMKMAKK